MVALNFKHLSFAELAGKLDYGQLAPIGWIYLEKVLYELTHSLEFGLRLTSMAASIGALVLFRGLVVRELDRFGALAAIALMAISGSLVVYASNVKPYAVDLFLVVIIMDAATRLMRAGARTAVQLAYLALAGAVTVLFSFAAVFALGACTGAVILKTLLERRFKLASVLVLIALVWLAGFAWLYLFVYSPQVHGTDLTTGGSDSFFSRTAYAPIPPKSLRDLLWYPDWAKRFFTAMFGENSMYAWGVLIVAGAWRLATRRFWLLLLALGGFAIAVLASSVKAYPLYDRLALFLLPGFIFLAGAGADLLVEKAKGAILPAAAVVGLALVAAVSTLSYNLKLQPPYANQQIPPLLALMQKRVAPGDAVYVGNVGIPGYMLYGPQYGLNRRPWIAGTLGERSWACVARRLPALAPGASLWMLYVRYDHPKDWPAVTPPGPGPGGDLSLEGRSADSSLYRLRVTSPAPARVADTGPATEGPCFDSSDGQTFDAPQRLLARSAAAAR